jgi:hypothetical protein
MTPGSCMRSKPVERPPSVLFNGSDSPDRNAYESWEEPSAFLHPPLPTKLQTFGATVEGSR